MSTDSNQIPAWYAFSGAPLAQVPEHLREEVRRHREDPDNPAHMPMGRIPAWAAYAGIPLDQIPDDGQRADVRRHRTECENDSPSWQKAQADPVLSTVISRSEIGRILDAWYDGYRRFSRIDEDVFLSLRNRLIPLTSGEPVQFREPGRQRWFNGTYEGPAGNPDDPNRSGDAIVLSNSGRRVSVFLSSVRRRLT